MAPATHKIVNGVRIELTSVEIAAIEAEWAARAAVVKPDVVDAQLQGDPMLRVLVRELATATGQTEDQIKNKVRAEL